MAIFDDLIFAHYGQSKSYDKTRHQLGNIRKTMIEFVPGFTKQRPATQFLVCQAALIVAIQTTTQQLREFRLNKPDPKAGEFKHSADNGYVPPTVIELNQPNQLRLLN